MPSSLICPRVLVADWDAETRAVLENMFQRKGCDVFRCVCPTQLRDMLEATSGERPLWWIHMLACDLSFVECLGLEYFSTLARSERAPAIVFKTDGAKSELIGELWRVPTVTIVEDVYDHSTQSSLVRLLMDTRRRRAPTNPPASNR